MRVKMNDIETFVRLKYQIATGSKDWQVLYHTYPKHVVNVAQVRYDNLNLPWMLFDERWKIYLRMLVEELCEWEKNHVDIGKEN